MQYILFVGDISSDCGVPVSGFLGVFTSLQDAKDACKDGFAQAIILVNNDNGDFETSYFQECGHSDWPTGSHPREWHEHKSLKWWKNK